VPGSGALGLVHYLGLVAAVAFFGLGMVVLWAARHRSEGERSVLPIVGKVGNPTTLTLGISLLVLGYHAVAYSLLPVVTLVSVPIDRWWLLVVICVVALAGSVLADRLEGDGSESEF